MTYILVLRVIFWRLGTPLSEHIPVLSAQLTWNGGAEHVGVDVDEAVYDALLAHSRGAVGFKIIDEQETIIDIDLGAH